MARKSRLSGRAWSASLGGVLLLALSGQPAGAQSLEEALANAYVSNPTIESQRAQLRATDELVPQALSGYRPTVEAGADAGYSRSRTRAGSRDVNSNLAQRGVDLSVVQPLYSGGRTQAGTKRAEALVEAQRADLLSTEQSVLLDGATAYLDVVRDQAVVDLNVNNEQVLRRQLDASRDRFNVGEITRTDVSQAESRLARALSDRIQAEGQLSSSRAIYARVIGAPPGRLSAPRLVFDLPSSREETVALAESNNPTVIAAEYSESAARNAVDAVRGEMLPSANLRGTLSRVYEPSSQADRQDGASVTASVTIPLYQAGSVESRVREARQTAGQRRIQIEESRRQVVENAIRAWEGLTTARATIESRQSQVRASEIALEGVRQEALVGSRTTLDTLDSEQELLDARVQLVQAQRNEMVAAFSVLSATGQLSARQLGLKVPFYDHTKHYNQVRGKWWGTDINE
ncbi:outer membrane protein/adhesin transport system outer membrane protein [Skermanella aerolata]|uniref:Type I secretion protein TolC n=1 Tax=Skermanella aerolata TaxID=393310 RepID=A0A512DX06_9PROT|nr:TolC family outer membrane protein [Skermanella aerolata]KJB93608.1 membrane protein [Skermanella aerolata KACC 11604]GEO41011.1 type I secretion protein TolC [Skermanella aerolata]